MDDNELRAALHRFISAWAGEEEIERMMKRKGNQSMPGMMRIGCMQARKLGRKCLISLWAYAVASPKGSRSITPNTAATPNRQIFQNFLGLDDWKT
jgi:hypothetical protein